VAVHPDGLVDKLYNLWNRNPVQVKAGYLSSGAKSDVPAAPTLGQLLIGPCDLRVGLRSHFRQLADERDEVPDRIVIQRFAPRGHCTHLDTVFNDPKRSLFRLHLPLCEVGRVRIKTGSNV
jgi:hypothetical protein